MSDQEFAIYALDVGAGQVGLSPVPGRFATYPGDLSVLLEWAPDLVLTLTSQAEMARVGATGLGANLRTAGVAWRHFPVTDFCAPDVGISAQWTDISIFAADILNGGGKILTHCFGGCGRSGMVALRLMIQTGENPDAALIRLRKIRPCAVETDAQRAWAISGV